MNEPVHITVSGREYVLGRLNLFDALEVSRLIAPIAPILLSEVIGKLASELQDENAKPEERLLTIATLLSASQPVLKIISEMPRADFQSIITMCLSVVEKKTASGYARLMQNGQLMFDDLDTMSAIALTIHVIARELNPIIASLAS